MVRKTKKRRAVIRKALRVKKAARVKKVLLPQDGKIEVIAPPDTLPIVAVDPETGTASIVAVPKKHSFWRSLFKD